jgi:hypothetical protein
MEAVQCNAVTAVSYRRLERTCLSHTDGNLGVLKALVLTASNGFRLYVEAVPQLAWWQVVR